jgi:ribosomal protein L44E
LSPLTGKPCVDQVTSRKRATPLDKIPKRRRRKASSVQASAAPGKNRRKKTKQPKVGQVERYCPRCRAFLIVTVVGKVWMIPSHKTKQGARCTFSDKAHSPHAPPARDALDYRVSGGFEGGRRR